MSNEDALNHLMYVFVEFNPNWMKSGWHLYLAPIENGLPNRASNQSVWLGRYDWMLERVLKALGVKVEGQKGERDKAFQFMRQYPNGALLWMDQYLRYFAEVGFPPTDVELWNCFREIREYREKMWLNDGKREDDEPIQE